MIKLVVYIQHSELFSTLHVYTNIYIYIYKYAATFVDLTGFESHYSVKDKS